MSPHCRTHEALGVPNIPYILPQPPGARWVPGPPQRVRTGPDMIPYLNHFGGTPTVPEAPLGLKPPPR